MNATARLTADASRAAAALPPLLAEAERAAASIWGEHGRRQAGSGETFWQYRQAQPGDAMQAIDWRRSGRSDELFVRETEWETAQTVWIWADDAASMRFQSKKADSEKASIMSFSRTALVSLSQWREINVSLPSCENLKLLTILPITAEIHFVAEFDCTQVSCRNALSFILILWII